MNLSLIVPAYNEEASIAKTLDSLNTQTYSNIELIVVDNNSTDNTKTIAGNYTKNVICESQQGYIYAVNRGAKEASGDLIAICDADSIYPKEWALKVVTEFQKYPDSVAVYGGASTHDASAIMNYINGVLYTNFLRVSRFLGLDNTSGFNFVMRRDAFLELEGYDITFTKMSPDIEMGKRLKTLGPIRFNPSIQVQSSFRRYQEGGTFKTQWMFFKAWWAMLRGQGPDISYDDYNQTP